MTPTQLTVTALGAAAIVWVLWYFLVPPKARPRAPAPTLPPDSPEQP